MKKTILIFAFLSLLLLQPVFPQSGQTDPIIIHLSKPGQPGHLNVINSDGNIKITGYNGNDVLIKNTSKNKKKFREYINVATEENGNGISISPNNDDYPIDFDITVPYSFSLNLNADEGKIEVRNISGELVLSNNDGDINLFNISGSGAVSNVDGNIFAEAGKSGFKGQIKLNSVDGKIELTLPSDIKTNLNVKSESGDIFTDFDINFNIKNADVEKSRSNGMTRISLENWIYGKINGGGKQITVQSVDGNIYIKKEK